MIFKKYAFTGGAILCLFAMLICTFSATAQKKSDDVIVDANGVMRWGSTKEEVHAFGVNYTAMFAHAYRTAKRLNISLEKAIDDDVYHFSRLGFDAFRVHVWDCEISDTLGNLLSNDHLRLFDYALKKMKDRGMKFIITPIAYWPNGYPEPPEKTPGFATKYGKEDCLTNEDAIKAQEKYLFQFLNHVNEYTGIAYKSDPSIIAFEISNEPHHQEAAEKVTTFINRMVKSMRNTGCRKPIFYNVSHSIQLADAYFKANIQGGTFQWYPTGLGARHELGGNLLPNVDKYTIPFANLPSFKKMARIVYEFDAADVGRSYIYPAMARSFREAGMQVATHFAYDPTFMADVNTEYNTHYMNLAFAPQKALSLKISSEVFHEIPMKKAFGNYPANTSFGNSKVNYEKDLAEYVTDTKFIYTNHTSTAPKTEKLESISGWGNSSLIQYEGTGAYFLDRLEAGVWRLEVMPDAIWIADPFERTSPKKKVAVINWRQWPMTINLTDLGENFTVSPLNDGNSSVVNVNGKILSVSPGTYLLQRKGVSAKYSGSDRWKNVVLKEFAAPVTTLNGSYVLHQPGTEITAGKAHAIRATIVTTTEPSQVQANVFGRGWRPELIKLEKKSGYVYEAVIPEKLVEEGYLRYTITVTEKDKVHTFPSGMEGTPGGWDFYDESVYRVRVVSGDNPVYLFNAATDAEKLSRQWLRTSVLKPLPEPNSAELLITIEKLFTPDPENKNGEQIHDYSMRYYFGRQISDRINDLCGKKKLIVRARSLDEKQRAVQVVLIAKDGSAYGSVISLGNEIKDYELSLAELKDVRVVTLPRPYPTFLPYYFHRDTNSKLDLNSIEVLQISIGPGISESELQNSHGLAIESIRVE
ncbi:MAG TPA: cellulase family glycosylhydrolase [Ohtaekwangia sp.]